MWERFDSTCSRWRGLSARGSDTARSFGARLNVPRTDSGALDAVVHPESTLRLPRTLSGLEVGRRLLKCVRVYASPEGVASTRSAVSDGGGGS